MAQSVTPRAQASSVPGDVDTLIQALEETGELLGAALRVVEARLQLAGVVLARLRAARAAERDNG